MPARMTRCVLQVNPAEEKLAKWTTCKLSGEMLQPPCVVDELGSLYNKVSRQAQYKMSQRIWRRGNVWQLQSHKTEQSHPKCRKVIHTQVMNYCQKILNGCLLIAFPAKTVEVKLGKPKDSKPDRMTWFSAGSTGDCTALQKSAQSLGPHLQPEAHQRCQAHTCCWLWQRCGVISL